MDDFQALHKKNICALTGMSQEIFSSSSEKLVKTENNEMTDFKSNIRTPRKSNIQVLPTLKAAAQWLKAQEDQVVKNIINKSWNRCLNLFQQLQGQFEVSMETLSANF